MPSRQAPARAVAPVLCGLAGLLQVGTAGCQEYACNGEPFVKGPGTPVIEHIAVTQPLVAPLPTNPWHLVLNVTFQDSGADLGGGLAFVHLYGSPQVSRSFSLDTYFRASQVPIDATSGVFALYMLIPPGGYQDAAHVQMDVQLEDASRPDPNGLFSNCYRMNLNFDAYNIPAAVQRLFDWGADLTAPTRHLPR